VKAQALKRFDFKNPDYDSVWLQRARRLQYIRDQPPDYLADLKEFYRATGDGIATFINDWGVTFDPRNPEIDRPALIPFVLFDKQREWVVWTFDHWKARKPSLTEKSRECGLSWLAIAWGCTVCMFYEGVVGGYGSRTIEYVDQIGEPKSLFWKARLFMREIPQEFSSGWDPNRHAPHKRIFFPGTGSSMFGESGVQIGRGARASWYLTDEEAFLEKPQSVEAALSQTTNARQSVSTPNGLGNPFERKAHGGKIDKFTFHWRDDPRKDEAWYQKQVEELDPIVVAQEIDINYSASVEGVLIPQAWVVATVDSIQKIKDKYGVTIHPTGDKMLAMDVADEGKDKNAVVGAHGVLVQVAREWSGIGGDIFDSVEEACDICDEFGYRHLKADGDGMGAAVRGDMRIVNAARKNAGLPQIALEIFRASAKVFEPKKEDERGRKNEDFFANAKSQGYWSLRTRFRNTFRWVVEGIACDPDSIICLPSTLENLVKLCGELSQPTFSTNNVGKIVIDKKPDGARSPNLADALMMRFARTRAAPLRISHEAIAKATMLARPMLNINPAILRGRR
jgi:phage terminase large subunit